MSKFGKIELITNILELARELSVRLRDLTFTDNFNAFIEDGLTINAGSSVRVLNKLQIKPKSAILMFSIGDANIGPSDVAGEAWTSNHIYLKNYGSNNATSVKFLITKE